MKTFSIDAENNIAVHTSAKQATAVENAECFHDEAHLTEIAAAWPASRLIEIWNSIPGVTPVKKFTNRKAAVSRIWKAVQSLVAPPTIAAPPTEAELANHAALGEAGEATTSRKHSKAKRARSSAKQAQTSNGKGPHEGSKTEIVLGLLKRKGGVTPQELMEATGWQAHSVHGFLSGTVGKKMGLALASVKRDDGARCYSL